MTFKDQIYKTCEEVAAGFDGWEFTSGKFENKSLVHASLFVLPGFGFDKDSAPLVNFQAIANALRYMPENLCSGANIFQNKPLYLAAVYAQASMKTK